VLQSIPRSAEAQQEGMMAQAKARQQSQDPYGQEGKTLTSRVQRLRGWVGSDPSKLPELADALVDLTAHRLLGHGYAAAAEDAQDSVRRAGELLAASGPIGPYTSISDAARYVTAVVHLAAIQAGMGMPDAAGRTIELLEDIREQLREQRLEVPLRPETVIWALSCSARAALVVGDAATANANADAAIVRLASLTLEMIRTPRIWRWTSTGLPRTPVGRRAELRKRSAICTQRKITMTVWWQGVSMNLDGSVRLWWSALPSRSSACIGTWRTGWQRWAKSILA
jgi:hypothetical protein